jgi:protein-S-isoprenylcysteine O-methyltransferase Ste14
MPVAAAAEPQSKPASHKAWTLLKILQSILMGIVWFGGMFLAAGTIRWLRGWIFTLAMLSIYAVVGFYIHLRNPGVLNARAAWSHSNTQPFDRWFLRLFAPVYMSQPIVAGLDAVRFRWSSMPFATVYLGLALLACGMAFIAWAMSVNPYAERTVRIQSDRGQTTVTTGPYRIVRHPMYVGAILMFPATGLIFGSWWTVVIGLVLALLFVWRTAMEDSFLLRELPGYDAYSANTSYRLLPGIW